MYDSHIYCQEYRDLKDQIVDILNGNEDGDVESLSAQIQELYDSGDMTASQYDDLMSHMQDINMTI